MLLIITIVLFSFVSIVSISQTDYSSQFSASKSGFSKRGFIAANLNTIINFTLNANSTPGFAKINVLVSRELLLSTNCFKKNKSLCN